MLKLFDDAHVDLRNGIELHDLPAEARRGVYRITKMEGSAEESGAVLGVEGVAEPSGITGG